MGLGVKNNNQKQQHIDTFSWEKYSQVIHVYSILNFKKLPY